MKSKIVALSFLLGALPVMGSVTLNTQFGTATNSAGVAVPNGTLWALVVDSNVSSSFAGGFGLDSSLSALGANSTFTIGQTISVGDVIGGDTVFAIGGFNGGAFTGMDFGALELTLGANGLVAGRNYAFYWFPGATYTSGTSGTIGSEVGGIHAGADAAAGLEGMVIPPDTFTVNTGASTANPTGGSIPDSRFQAVQLIPEPSTALLGAIGALGLLRRRR